MPKRWVLPDQVVTWIKTYFVFTVCFHCVFTCLNLTHESRGGFFALQVHPKFIIMYNRRIKQRVHGHCGLLNIFIHNRTLENDSAWYKKTPVTAHQLLNYLWALQTSWARSIPSKHIKWNLNFTSITRTQNVYINYYLLGPITPLAGQARTLHCI